uniref:EOG090X04W0 n=1 Tax=Moina brachiata TaxID=675436 RepID=A0A4Y7NIC6_9CRUS|nr:EOG090X04W0 [Moina brachiata]SVE92969.1 EOG090X04W0 [Moina brachiata]
MLKNYIILFAFAVYLPHYSYSISYQVQIDEVLIIPLSPALFNLSQTDSSDEITYSGSLQDVPDLPKWLQVVQSPNKKMGFLFGTPNQFQETLVPNVLIKVEAIATNLATFETSTVEMTLEVIPKQDPSPQLVKLKIHNANLEDFMESHKQDRLLDVFRNILWPESANDLHFVELYSALLAGGRRPARRQDGEGVVLTLGSQADFSDVMRELEREVSSLWPLRNCPRDFKKTSAERYFRTKGFLLDWCSFKLVPQNVSLVQVTSTVLTDLELKPTKHQQYSTPPTDEIDFGLWIPPGKWEVPLRSYAKDGVVAVFIPLMILLILSGLLTAVLGVHPEGSVTEEGQLYEAVFEELPFFKPKNSTVTTAAEKLELPASGLSLLQTKTTKLGDSNTPSLSRIKRNPLYESATDSGARDSSPFLMSGGSSPLPTPMSTLNRSANQIFRPTIVALEKAGTLSRPEPPPYTGTLRK